MCVHIINKNANCLNNMVIRLKRVFSFCFRYVMQIFIIHPTTTTRIKLLGNLLEVNVIYTLYNVLSKNISIIDL